MNKIIITDIDECVLQWQKGFIEFMESKFNKSFDIKSNKHSDVREFMNLSDDQMEEYLFEFNNSHKFGELLVGYNSDIYLPKLHQEGYKIYALTSCGSSENTKTLRKKNILEIFGDIFENIICIDYSESKRDYLHNLPKNSIWVEDNSINSSYGIEFNHRCFLIHHDYNSKFEHDKITKVSDWSEIYNILNNSDE